MSKLKIALVLGGTSNEREVSLKTGKQIEKNLDRRKYEIKIYDTKSQLAELFFDCQNKKNDLCFLALHGRGGEDGSIQGMLDLLNIPYTGSGTMSSALCINKIMSKNVLCNYPEISLAKGFSQEGNTEYPCVVKPNISGSSVGITIVRNESQLKSAISNALKHDRQIIIEEYIDGVEITVPILGEEPLPIIEICPKNSFFDYEAKYTKGRCNEIVPARITDEQTKTAQALALKIHRVLGCSGITRTDFILKNNKLYFLEINTIPGMTEISLCPKSAKTAGINFPDLLDKIINLALNKHH